jgi:hypothetical protein
MEFRITIDIFSGRKNPVIELKGREAARLYERLRPARRLSGREMLPAPPSILGYRGLIIAQSGARGLPKSFRVAGGDLIGPQLSHRAADEEVEWFIARSAGLIQKLRLGNKFPSFLLKEIERFREIRERCKFRPPRWPRRERCRCAPLYEPNWWNDNGQKQWNNNCYNYSTNYRTDTFAQPGLAAGAEYTALTCASVRPAALADDLIDSPNANNKCSKEGHLVALVIAPGWDFHWYRKGRNGYWTHKPGGTPATNVDNSGALIPDPRTANRGPYTDFCTFMVVMHGHIKIR